MSTDIRLAFAHPEERAEATAAADPRDRISLRDHLVEADIGAFQTERGQKQRLLFNIVVELRPQGAPIDDDVDRILSYDRLTEAIADALAVERVNLLETLAERVAERILAEPRAMRVFVRIEKLDRGPGALGVEIVRTRAAVPLRALDPADAKGEDRALHPVVAYMDNAMIADAAIAARLDALEAGGAPVVICVGLPDTTRPPATPEPVRRRIDLLAIEQNAWALAAHDRRCLVVASRTEIDWAMRQGQTIVWAPSKLVLDTPDGPLANAGDGPALAMWLAETLAASVVLMPEGTAVPRGSRVPVQPYPALVRT
ncbi:MAG: dihydroneopterin aldolase [Pararhodobacter sp.]